MKVIGVDVGATKISAGLVVNDQVKKVISKETKRKSSQQAIVSQITSLIDEIVDKKVKSIGVGVPAIVDLKRGILFEAFNIASWKRVPLKRILESKYQIPVFINNDANCFALGEKYFGKGRNHQDLVGISLGSGLGAGIIINEKLYCGNNCGAGEFGSIRFRKGYLEDYCSGKFFIKEYGIDGGKLFQKAKQGNKKALAIFKKFGANLGEALSIVVNSVDPEVIVIGGSVAESYLFFRDSMNKSLQKIIYKRSYSRLKIKVSTTKNMNVLGAAALCFDAKK